MSEISGAQWARIWAYACHNAAFKKILENKSVVDAVQEFKKICDATVGYAPFPSPPSKLIDLKEMDEYGYLGKKMSEMTEAELNHIIKYGPSQWQKSQWLDPKQVTETLEKFPKY
jgi:hypothetical protein